MWRRAVAASASRARPPAPNAAAAAPKASRAGTGSSPRAATALLLAAHDEGVEPAPAPDDQRAGPGHPAELVRAHADQVGVERAQIGRDVPTGRRGVDVHGDAGVATEPDHLVHRLEGAHLVVAPLAVDQRGAGQAARPQAGPEGIDVEPTGRVHPDLLGRRGAPGGVTDGGVLHGGAEHGRAGRGPGRAPDGRVDRLRPSRGEDHLARRDAQQIGHLRPRPLERVADGAGLFVQPARVARRERGPLRQGGEGLGPRRGRAGVVEVGASHAGLRQRRCRRRRPGPARTGSRGGPVATPCRTAAPATP